jgi:hypothetical protein
MQRIVKRLLLHRQDGDDLNDNFDELKQDLQMIRYEMNNDSRKAREEIVEVLGHINLGIKLVGEELFKLENQETSELARRFQEFRLIEFHLKHPSVELNEIPGILDSKQSSSSASVKALAENNEIPDKLDSKHSNSSASIKALTDNNLQDDLAKSYNEDQNNDQEITNNKENNEINHENSNDYNNLNNENNYVENKSEDSSNNSSDNIKFDNDDILVENKELILNPNELKNE